MIWAARLFSRDGWYILRDQFEEAYEAAGAPNDMMLAYADTPSFDTVLFIGVPDTTDLSPDEDFEVIDERTLPRNIRLLFGDETLFRERARLSRASSPT
jgi:hypothetical protein